MNVLLIYPSYPDTFWSFKYALKFIRKKAAYPPLGLLTVAALLPEEWSKRYLKRELLPALIQWRQGKKGCVFYTETSINLADDQELMRLMVRAGFDSVFIGIESPDEDSLTECRKYQNKNRNLLKNVKIIQRAGLQVLGGFIIGFDSDNRSTFRLGIRGRERFQYWHLLAWTLIHRPRHVSLAITLAIYGYHFRRICERYIL